MEFKTRITSIMDVYNLNAAEFADKIDVQRSSISHIMSGRNKPSLDFMIKIKDAFPEVQWDWLILGKGTMLKSENDVMVSKSNILSPTSSSEEIIDSQFDLFEDKMEVKTQEKSIPSSKMVSSRKLIKVLFMYSDGVFEEFNPA